MFFWLQGSVEKVEEFLADEGSEALIELGEAGYKSRHVVGCSRQVARMLSARSELSDRSRAYFRRIYGEYTQLGSVFSRPESIIIDLEVVEPLQIGGVWRVPLGLFSEEIFSSSCVVVCENDTDFEIYEHLARFWMRSERPDCVVSAVSRAGHGGSTSTVIRRVALDPNPLYLCIVDSDRNVVLGGEGPTARGVRRAWVESWRGLLKVLECRELENALPIGASIKCEQLNRRSSVVLEALSDVDEDIREFACHKVGERLCRFHDVDSSAAGHGRTKAGLLSTSHAHDGFRLCGVQCGDCDCAVVPELGEGFLSRFADWLRSSASKRDLPPPSQWSDSLRDAVEAFAIMSIALPRRV